MSERFSGLTVRDLSVGRGAMPLLANVSFEIAPGAALILRGPNGIGKTTLLRALAGLQPVLVGEVSVGPDQVAYAAHADGIKGVLSVTENLQFWADMFDAGDIKNALQAYDLAGLAGRSAQNLSAGQKRRLGLARLLVTGRPLWLLDEPTVSLDAANVALFAAAVRAHLADGGAALIATHVDLGLDAPVLELDRFRATADIGDFDGDGGVFA